MYDRAQLPARLVYLALEYRPAFRDDGNPLAQPLGVGDDVRRKNDGDARRRLVADQLFELLLVQGIESGKGLIQDDQPGLVNDSAE